MLVSALFAWGAVFAVAIPALAQDAVQVTEGASSQNVAQTTVEAAQPSTVWRVLQLTAFVGLILSLAGMSYGIVLWRNGSQNNDILVLERGRRLALVFGIVFVLCAVLLLISFVVIRSQQRRASQQAPLSQPVGQSGLDTRDALLLIDALPSGVVPIRNVQVQLLFNQDITQTGIEQNAYVRKTGETAPVAGSWSVKGSRAIFVPNQACPSPNEQVRCFDANVAYEAVISSALTSADGDAFRCPSPTSQCAFGFVTGEAVDTIAPTARMTLPYNDAAVGQNSSVLLEALALDDYAVAFLEFFVDGSSVGVAPASGPDVVTEFRGSATWLTIDLALKSRHAITAAAVDLAGQTGLSPEISVEILPAYCFDGQQNEDEEGVDCGGPTCRLCQGAACTENSQCASGLCVGGFCRDYPVIEEVIEANGAPGNFVTVRGRNFGTETGTLVFLGLSADDDDATVDAFPCVGAWSNTQVVLQVPANARTGALRLTTAEGLYDTTDDDKGGRVIFEINDTRRPGLCAVEPGSQQVGEPVTLRGNGFGATLGDVSFGQARAGRIGTWADEQISDVVVPSLPEGVVPVRVQVGPLTSNPVFMSVTSSPTLPRLDSVSPDRGPVGQIFSIIGENLSRTPLVKFLNPRTGEVTLADTRLPDSCLRFFRKGEQRAFRVPRLDPGIYEVFLETDAGRSNPASFTVTAGGRLPGLCAMEPDNGPLGIETVLYGEGFGVNKGGVRFHSRVDISDVVSWNDGQIRVAVPPTAQTGLVQVIASTGQLSNGLNFRVGQCSPDTCGTGFECCSSGACQAAGTCSEALPLCTYSWTFGTGDDLGGIPRVIEQATCKNNTQSPSPFKDTVDACLNAAVSARFTHDMKDATLNAGTVELRRCNTGPSFDGGSCQTTVSLSNFVIINSNQPGEGFIAQPQPAFVPDTWYQVTIANTVEAENGNRMENPYRWTFKTQSGEGACAVDHVEVTPATATLKKVGATQAYTGVATALNCNILDGSAYTWGWLSADTSKAVLETSRTYQNRATAKGATDPGPAVDIIASIPEFSKEDSGQLRISLEPPLVVDKWPNCSSACINAALGAKFNQEMQEASVTANANVELHECKDAACARANTASIGVTSLTYNNTSFTLHFLPNISAFKVATKYRVVLKGMRSASGLPLSGLNYDADGDGTIDSYSWLFSTRNDPNQCQIEDVLIDPPTAISSLILEEFNYQALPVAPADACNQYGQILRGDTMDWVWGVSVPKVASVTQQDVLPLENFKDWAQITTSRGEGSTKVRASTQGVNGEGDFTVQCGFQTDNQCPSPATVQSHGVGSDSCCYPRPGIIGSNPRNGAEAVCTTLGIELEFDQPMNQASLVSGIILEINNGGIPCPSVAPTAWWPKAKYYASRALSWVIPATQAQGENWCRVESSVSVSNTDVGSSARVYPKQKLQDDRQYRVRTVGDLNLDDNVPEGVRNSFNVAVSGEDVRTFRTGKAECKLDYVDVLITPPGEPGRLDVAFCAARNDCPGDVNATKEGNQHAYLATGRDRAGFIVPADFTWTVEGDPILTLDPATGEQVEMTPNPQNGEATVTVTARAQAPSQGTISRTLDVVTFLCENPWPDITSFPYVDTAFNYDIFYCRDAGEPGFDDDLPPLSSPVTGQNVGGVLKESLFIIE